MTLRQAASQVRKLLKPLGFEIKGSTTSFAGLGYGSAGFVEIYCPTPLSNILKKEIEKIQDECKTDPENKIIFSLRGPAYPFGGKI